MHPNAEPISGHQDFVLRQFEGPENAKLQDAIFIPTVPKVAFGNYIKINVLRGWWPFPRTKLVLGFQYPYKLTVGLPILG
jgi:hypothetical protein